MPLKTFAWLLHCNDESSDAVDWDISVNWVMPWGSSGSETWPKLAVPGDLDGAAVIAAAGNLLFPWEHSITEWHAVEVDAANLYTIVPAHARKLSAVADEMQIQQKVRAEIEGNVAGCPAPFSSEPEYLLQPDAAQDEATPASRANTSLPHAFAPLTHLPAPLAGAILGMTRSFQCDAAKRSSFRAFAPEFAVEIGGAVFSLKPASATATGEILTIAYAFRDAGTGSDGPFGFQVITKMLEAASPSMTTDAASCELGGAERADLPARETLVARALSPIELVDASVARIDEYYASHPDAGVAAASAEQLLVDSLGDGTIRVETISKPDGKEFQRYVGVWERLANGTEKNAEEIALAYVQVPLEEKLVVGMLAEAKKAKDLLPDLWNALAQLDTALSEARAAQPEKNWPAASYGTARGRAVVGAAAALLRSPTAHYLWAAWLANLAMAYSSTRKNSEFWNATDDFPTWYARLAAALDDHTTAAMLCGPKRRTLAIDWPNHAGMIGYGKVKVLRDALADGVYAMIKRGTAESGTDAAVKSILRSSARRRVFDLRQALAGQDAGGAPALQLSEDRDLSVTVTFNAAIAAKQPVNKEIRGYAIAIAAGYTQPSADLNWQWLSDVAAKVRDGKGWKTLVDAEGATVRLHDTVGATKTGGRDVISFVYSGMPLNGRLNTIEDGEVDSDGVDTLDFFWPDEDVTKNWTTPKLAYGLRYWALATPIGNAGRVIHEQMRDRQDSRKLVDLHARLFTDFDSVTRYECRVAPGSPVIALADRDRPSYAYELADESRTRVHLAQNASLDRSPGTHRIALIRPVKGGWVRGKSEIKFSVRGPDGTPNVIERWLEADRAQRCVKDTEPGKPVAGDPDAAALDEGEIVEAQRRYRSILKPARSGDKKPAPPHVAAADDETVLQQRRNWPRHPAVRAFGIEVQMHDPAGMPLGPVERHLLKPVTDAAGGYISHAYIKVKAGNVSGSARLDAREVEVVLAPGAFAKVTAYSLAPEEFFNAASGLGRMAAFEGAGVWTEAGARYRSFAPAIHWFECLPAPADDADRAAINNALFKAVETRLATARSGCKLRAQVEAMTTPAVLDATWIKGFLVQRHEWHWTGYPIAFPRTRARGPTLLDWAEPFMGTESLRESLFDELQTEIGGAGKWHFATSVNEVLATSELPSEHGARFIAHVLRPVRRFDRWLPRWPEFDQAVLGAGLLVNARVRWDDPALRLPPPDVGAAVPLVKTFAPGANRLNVCSNGCMLVLSDVLYRTDPMTRLGGVGEVIEVDLEETRFNEVYEIGPNPIMHAGPTALTRPAPLPGQPGRYAVDGINLPYASVYARNGAQAHVDAAPVRKMNWRLRADKPFGLTNDLDRNPRVAQSAIVVHPEGNDVGTYWVMAKVRLRRLLDPDPRWTEPWPVAIESNLAHTWSLTRRAEGEDWVPHDFCIDVESSSWGGTLALAPGPTLLLDHGQTGAPVLKSRYLCTWHKGQWNNTDRAYWGLQVRFQQLFEERGQWETMERISAYETNRPGQEIDARDAHPARLEIIAAPVGAEYRINRLLASDYSASHWLTFIGLPFRNMALAEEAYWLVRDHGALRLMRSNRATGNVAIKEDGEPVSRDLLLNPVKGADFESLLPATGREQVEHNSFHLLLLFKRVNDLTAPGVGMPLGELINAYKPVRGPVTDTEPYPPVRFVSFMESGTTQDLPDERDCTGYIYRFQTPHGKNMPAIDNWQQLQAYMFPVKDAQSGEGPEARVRWTPEFIGPISLAMKKAWPLNVARPAATGGTRIRIQHIPAGPAVHKKASVQIVVNPEIGWRVSAKQDADAIVADDIVGGTCSRDRALEPGLLDGLELQMSGGRLLARLGGWSDGKPLDNAPREAIMFDDDGKRREGVFQWTVL